MRCVWKVTGLVTQTICFNSNQQTTYVISLGFNVFLHPSLLCFYALLEEFFWDAFHFCCYSPLDSLCAFKMGPFDDRLEIREKKQVRGNRLDWIGKFFPYDDAFFRPAHPVHLLFRIAQIFQTMSFFMFKWYWKIQPTISKQRLSYPPEVDFRFTCWRPPDPGVIFHLLAPLKNTCDMVLC